MPVKSSCTFSVLEKCMIFFQKLLFFLLEEKSGRRQIAKVQFSSFYKNLLGVHTNFLSILTFKKVIDMLPVYILCTYLFKIGRLLKDTYELTAVA